jgi:hypothetical protein
VAIAVLREAIASGVNHLDTSDFYGPHVTNRLIKRALHPYPNGLAIVTKVGYRRGADKPWISASSRKELVDGIHDNLRNLGLDTLNVVNLRVGGNTGPSEGSSFEPSGCGTQDSIRSDCRTRSNWPSHRDINRMKIRTLRESIPYLCNELHLILGMFASL